MYITINTRFGYLISIMPIFIIFDYVNSTILILFSGISWMSLQIEKYFNKSD